jgi:endoribonuclease Dicer
MKQCQFIYFVEKDNSSHEKLLQEYQVSPAAELSQKGQSSSTISEQGITHVPTVKLDDFIEDPTTGRRIYPKGAVGCIDMLMKLVVALTSNGSGTPVWHELQKRKDGSPVCLFKLPDQQWVPRPLARLAARAPQGADEIACFIACRELYEAGLLNDPSFFPLQEAQDRTDMTMETENAKTANVSANTRCYPKKKPLFWTRSLLGTSHSLHPVIVSVQGSADACYAPMLVLARLPLPKLDAFDVFSLGRRCTIRLHNGVPLHIDERKLDLLFRYTLRITRTLLNKPVEGSIGTLCYFFAPLDVSWPSSPMTETATWRLPDVESHIAWSQVEEAAERWVTRLVPEDGVLDEDSVRDCIIQDRAVEFTNRHYVVKLRTDLSPLSRMEDGSVSQLSILQWSRLIDFQREEGFKSYLDYCKERVKGFHGLNDETQPLIEVSLVPPVLNNLAPTAMIIPPSNKTTSRSKCADVSLLASRLISIVFIPELCYRFVISAR